MSEHNPQEPQARPEDDDLSVEELEQVAGGGIGTGSSEYTIGVNPDDTSNTNCSGDCNINCPC